MSTDPNQPINKSDPNNPNPLPKPQPQPATEEPAETPAETPVPEVPLDGPARDDL